jgi:hypothetical protein
MWTNNNIINTQTANTDLAIMAVQCSLEIFVDNQIWVLCNNICGEKLHHRQLETVSFKLDIKK